MKGEKKQKKGKKDVFVSDDMQTPATDGNGSFEDFAMFDNMDGDYQFFDGIENFDSEVSQEKSEADDVLLLADPQDNAIITAPSPQEIVLDENKPIKLREIAVQSDTAKVNAFDLFFLRVWAGMVSLLSAVANGVNYVFNAIFKHKLPVKYIKAFLVVLLIICLLLIIIIPVASNGGSSASKNDGLTIFECNLVPVKVRVDTEGGTAIYKWGYLDKSKAATGTGKDSLAIPAKYEEALPFNKYGIAWGRVRDESGHYWELINKKGKRVGSRTYAVNSSVPISERPFGEFTSSKLAWINENGKYGYIDTKGNVKIACDLDVAGDFVDGIARVGRGNYEWYINKSGKAVGRSYDYIQVLDFSCGLGAVNKGGRWGYVNKKGKEVIELKYDAASQFVDGYAMVKMGKTFGIIDTKGKLILNTQWYYDVIIENEIFEEFIANNKD